jgi:hypothetical protein
LTSTDRLQKLKASSVWISPSKIRPSRLLSSSSIARAHTTFYLAGIGFIPTAASLPQCISCLIQWDGDEVEVVHADDSIEISHAAMSIWDAEDQEPISGISLEGCDRIEATKNRVRLVLSTGLTE